MKRKRKDLWKVSNVDKGATFPRYITIVERKTRKKKRVFYRSKEEMEAVLKFRNMKGRAIT